MTERELRADLRALVQRWETDAAQARASGYLHKADALDDCIDDVREFLV